MTTSFPAHFFLTRKDHGSKSARLFLVIFCLNNFILGVFAPALTFLDPRAPTIVLRSEMENIFSTSRSLLVAMKNILWHETLLSLILFIFFNSLDKRKLLSHAEHASSSRLQWVLVISNFHPNSPGGNFSFISHDELKSRAIYKYFSIRLNLTQLRNNFRDGYTAKTSVINARIHSVLNWFKVSFQ